MLLSSIRSEINNLQAMHPNNLEIEVRYGAFVPGKSALDRPTFQPGVSIQTFSRLQTSLSRISPVTLTSSRDEVMDDLRRTIIGGKEEWLRKPRPILTRNLSEYGIRVTGTQEFPIPPVTSFKPTYFRDKTRYSYLLAGGAVRADLTRVESGSKITYEVELELMSGQSIEALSRVTELILKIIQDTPVLYTDKDRRDVTAYFNNLLGDRHDTSRLDHGVLKQSRNLKMADLVWGGLIGNASTGYKVSHKVDGSRKLLVFAPNGIWLLHPPFDYTRLTTENFPTMTGTVLDGELVPKDKRKEGAPIKQYWYLVFDALSWQGDIGTQQQPHNDRMKIAQLAIDRLESPLLAANTLRFRSFASPNRFFEVMREMIDEQKELGYYQDGFSFTAESAEYNPKGLNANGKKVSVDLLPLTERRLTIYADNLKWKDVSNLTIDFLIRKTSAGVEVYSTHQNEIVPFLGSLDLPFDGKVETSPFLEAVPSESIVEFKWDQDKFTPVIVRNNKTKPNRLEIAIDVWSDIHQPVTTDLLTGRSFDLLTSYLSRVRQGLLHPQDNEANLLVLGLDLDVDLSTWKQYQRIIIYDPDDDLRNEIVDRASADPSLVGRVRSIQSLNDVSGEIKKYFSSKADVISLTHRVGIWWESRDRLNDLVTVIEANLSPNGRIAFLFLDGDTLDEMFDPVYTPQLRLKALDADPAIITYDRDRNQVTTTYPDVSFTETPVFIYNLLGRMSRRHVEIYRGDTEEFLSSSEKMLSRLYSFGMVNSNPRSNKMNLQSTKKEPSMVEAFPDVIVSPKIVNAPALMINPSRLPDPINPTPIPPQSRIVTPKLQTRVVPIPTRRPVARKGTTAPKKPVELPLSLLKVYAPRGDGIPGIGDDKLARLTITWSDEEVYRIACIGDGSCFFHSYLKGFYPPYQNNNSFSYRYNLVRAFRDDFAGLITQIDPDDPEGRIFYFTVANGAWAALAEQQEMGLDLYDAFGQPLDWSLEGIIDLFTSDRDVGDETYSFITEIIGIGVYVVRGTQTNIHPQVSVGIDKPSVVIMGNGSHYELVAIRRQDGLQTLFDPDDPFLKQLRALSGTEGQATV